MASDNGTNWQPADTIRVVAWKKSSHAGSTHVPVNFSCTGCTDRRLLRSNSLAVRVSRRLRHALRRIGALIDAPATRGHTHRDEQCDAPHDDLPWQSADQRSRWRAKQRLGRSALRRCLRPLRDVARLRRYTVRQTSAKSIPRATTATKDPRRSNGGEQRVLSELARCSTGPEEWLPIGH